jgi:hypothetical protein
MARLREIQRQTAEHERELAAAHAESGADPTAWAAVASGWDFSAVNDLIDRHNRWYPIESRLPLDPRTGDYMLVNGKHYGMTPLDATWVHERFPAGRANGRSQRA